LSDWYVRRINLINLLAVDGRSGSMLSKKSFCIAYHKFSEP